MDELGGGSWIRWSQRRWPRDWENKPCHRGAGVCRLIVGNDEVEIGTVVADLVAAGLPLGTEGEAVYIPGNALPPILPSCIIVTSLISCSFSNWRRRNLS